MMRGKGMRIAKHYRVSSVEVIKARKMPFQTHIWSQKIKPELMHDFDTGVSQ